eukprot:NODE_134_length_16603_cov_0.784052.p5 type:complete len:367 gc:universal NODE_134_length_16603_cov_0.784052:8893-7793(-)
MNDSLFVPLMAFVMTIFTSWMLGLHVDSVSLYHTAYSTFLFGVVCFMSLMCVTDNPYKSNFYKMLSIYLIFPLTGWLIVSIVKISSRSDPIWDVSDIDFLDVICFVCTAMWQYYLCFKGMPTYYELFYYGVFEKSNNFTTKIVKIHKAIGAMLTLVYLTELIALVVVQENTEAIIHIIFNFLPIIIITIASAMYLEPQKLRSDAKIFSGSNYSLMWVVILIQISLLVQSVTYLVKFVTYETCSDCYLGLNYFFSAFPLFYYVLFGFQRFTIKHEKYIPKFVYEDQVLFFTRTAMPLPNPTAADGTTDNADVIVPAQSAEPSNETSEHDMTVNQQTNVDQVTLEKETLPENLSTLSDNSSMKVSISK